MPPKLTKKMAAHPNAETLELTVSKTGGPVATAAEVTVAGGGTKSFSDQQLTPGPASMPIDSTRAYNIVWSGAFVKKGSATLKVRLLDAGGSVLKTKSTPVSGEAKEKFFRLIVLE